MEHRGNRGFYRVCESLVQIRGTQSVTMKELKAMFSWTKYPASRLKFHVTMSNFNRAQNILIYPSSHKQ